jgi:hypothetical protein
MRPDVPGRPRRSGFPLALVLTFAGCGLLAGWALVWWVSWWLAFGFERDWWSRPEKYDGSGAPFLLALLLSIPAVVLGMIGARRGRRVYGWSRLATLLVGLGSALGAAIVIGFAASVA